MLVAVKVAAALVGSYLLGNLLGGTIVAKLKGIDIRKQGSGNIGATNVLRTIGPVYAAGTLVFDAVKAIGAVVLGRWTGVSGVDAACGLLAIAGHNWPVLASFRGGKGMATILGSLIVLAPNSLTILLPFWAIVILSTGLVSLGSVTAAAAIPIVLGLLYRGQPGFIYLLGYGILAAAIAIYRHRDNIKRLRQGTENNLWRSKRKSI